MGTQVYLAASCDIACGRLSPAANSPDPRSTRSIASRWGAVQGSNGSAIRPEQIPNTSAEHFRPRMALAA